MAVEGTPKRRISVFEHLFLQYGAGSKLIQPVTNCRLWNRICWTAIVIGMVGWMVAFWLLRGYSE